MARIWSWPELGYFTYFKTLKDSPTSVLISLGQLLSLSVTLF